MYIGSKKQLVPRNRDISKEHIQTSSCWSDMEGEQLKFNK